jgi:hypothetical protein
MDDSFCPIWDSESIPESYDSLHSGQKNRIVQTRNLSTRAICIQRPFPRSRLCKSRSRLREKSSLKAAQSRTEKKESSAHRGRKKRQWKRLLKLNSPALFNSLLDAGGARKRFVMAKHLACMNQELTFVEP